VRALDRPLQVQPIDQPLPLGLRRGLRWPRRLPQQRARRSGLMAAVSHRLDLRRDRQHVPQPLVLDDRALVDLREPVVGDLRWPPRCMAPSCAEVLRRSRCFDGQSRGDLGVTQGWKLCILLPTGETSAPC